MLLGKSRHKYGVVPKRDTHTGTRVKGGGYTFSHKDTMVYGGCINPQLKESIIERVFLVDDRLRVVKCRKSNNILVRRN